MFTRKINAIEPKSNLILKLAYHRCLVRIACPNALSSLARRRLRRDLSRTATSRIDSPRDRITGFLVINPHIRSPKP